MSLITQCPACSTLFKVVPDQLRISQGWVRCGQCDEVFDANVHMRNLSADSAAIAPDVPPAEQSLASHMHRPPHPQPQPAPDLPIESKADDYDWDGVLDNSHSPPVEHEAAADSFLEKSPQELMDAVEADMPAALPDVAEPGPVSDYPGPVSFMATPPPARQQSVFSRIVWATGLVFLLLGLALQVLMHERDRLAATQPALKPLLLAMCELASCKLNAYQQIDAIVIDSSTFSKVQQDVYKLSVTLKNNAALEIAKPALELTLTDSQDQAVLRKVLSAAELGDRSLSLAPGEDVSWTIPIAVKPSEGTAKIAGYRVLAFYP